VMDALAARKPAGMVVDPVFQNEMKRPIQQLIKSGIPIATIQEIVSVPGQVSNTVSSQIGMGKIGANILAQAIGGKGKVFIIDFAAGSQSTDDRRIGFLQQIKAKYPGITYVGNALTGVDTNKAAQVMTSTLQRHPDLAGVWGTDIYGIQGVLTALQQAGKIGKVKVVSPDALPSQLDWLKKKQVEALVAQKPGEIGALGVNSLIDFIEGAAKARNTTTYLSNPYQIITKANMNDPKVRQFVNDGKC
jgi:ribose transport system substrate-binding protein